MSNTNPRRSEIAHETNARARAAKAERLKEIGDRLVGKDPNHPIVGSQKWAEQHGLAEKEEDPK